MPKVSKKTLAPGLYSRNGTLWGRIQIAGREHRRSLRTADPKEAARRLTTWRDELRRVAAGGDETFQDAVVRWAREVLPGGVKPQVQRRYLASMAMLDATFGGLRLIEIRKRTIATYVASRAGTVSNATIRRDLTALSRLLSCCVAWGWLEENPVDKFDRSLVPERKRVFQPPTEDELATVLGYAPVGMAAILRFLNQTGARLDEAVSLQRPAIDWQGRTITLLKTKTTPRAIAFSTPGGDVTGILAAAVPHVRSPFVFRSRDDKPYVQMSTGFGAVMGRAIYEEALAGRELRRFRIHDLRHGFAIRWLKAGGSIYDLKKHLGHTSVSTTEIYLGYLTAGEQESAQRPAQAQG